MKKNALPVLLIALTFALVFAAFVPEAVAAGDWDYYPDFMPAETIGVVADGHYQFIPVQCGSVTETDTHFYVGAWKILKKYAFRPWTGDLQPGSCVIPLASNSFYTISYYGYTYKYVPEFGWLSWGR